MRSTMCALPYLLPYAVPLVVVTADRMGARWAFASVIWVFLAAFVADVVVKPDLASGSQDQTIAFRVLTWLWLPAQIALVLTGLFAVSRDGSQLFFAAVSVGAAGGMFGIPAAHELMHRRSRVERGLAVALMTLFSYAHFCIEHVRGHHANVGTRRDPATARLGESLYAFLPRTVIGGFLSACRIDPARVLVYWMLTGVVYVAVALRFGARGVAFFALQSAVAVLLIEILNYVEHYGLVRGEGERVGVRHSWDSAHRVSNWMMFNVARHADHHRDASRGYAQLRNAEGARRLPAGYFAMFVLALFPPLWRQVMDPLATMGGDDAAEPVGP